jgi:glycosyltransferase involved in cell wall biosynthesis
VTEVHIVVPDGIDDTARPSGGNIYDRQVCRGLTSLGWSVREHAVPGCWPRPDAHSLATLAGVLQGLSDKAVVLLDGLVASAAPEVLVPQASRLRLVVLVHMSLGHRPTGDRADAIRCRERAVLSAATAVVTTSAWTRHRLGELYHLPARCLHVAQPGVEPAGLAAGTPEGGALLCVAAVTFQKGYDVLLDALQTLSDLPWHCVCVGSLDRELEFVTDLRRRSLDAGMGDRVNFPGPRTGAELDRSYAAADLVVLPSRAEAYGMVVTEALARGLPVAATEVGGVPEALGHGADGARPGLLVRADDAGALASALRDWLSDADLRGQLRRAASERRESLSGWSKTASVLAGVLEGASAGMPQADGV